MRGKLCLQAPPTLVVLALLVFIGILLRREASMTEDLPDFLPPRAAFVYVELTGGGWIPGVYQFNDGLTPQDVIKLTVPSSPGDFPVDPVWSRPLCSGESLELIKKDQKIELLQRGWMTARHRIALAIPLHPDRMNREDWIALPGVGMALAERIEHDRQKNGDFGSLDALVRVKGIGKKRLDSWKIFF